MNDPILATFLEEQHRAGMDLAARSDLFDLVPLGEPPHQRYLAYFHCKGLVRRAGRILEAERFDVGIRFPDDYLKRVDMGEVLTLLMPLDMFHPNVRAVFICPGALSPGTSLVDLIYACFEIFTYTKVTMNEYDALNREACVWARENLHRFPLDRRPLVRP